MLSDLGVTTSLGDRNDPNGEALPEDYNPIGPLVGILFKQCEIFVAGVGVGSYDHAVFQDRNDGNGGYPVLFQESDDAWASGYPKSAVAADVDGDGLDEIVISIFYTNDQNEIALRIIDNGETDPAREVTRFDAYGDLSAELSGTAGGTKDYEDAFYRQDLAAGDLDGDGKDELIVVEAGHVFVLDDLSTSFSLVHEFSVINLKSTTDTYVRVAIADFDADGRDEFVLTNGEDDSSILAEYSIYDDISTDPTMSSPLKSRIPIAKTDGVTIQLYVAGVTTGDFDGDGLPEIAFSGMRMDEATIATMILDTEMDSSSRPVFNFLSSSTGDRNETGLLIPAMGSGDIDGDGDDELVAWEDIYVLDPVGDHLGYHHIWGNDALTTSLVGNRDDAPDLDLLSVGDVTGDMKADVVFITSDNTAVRVVHVSSSGDGSLDYEDVAVSTDPTRPTICLPNVDDDSAVVRFTGHELLFTDPVVVAVLASPPFWNGINNTGTGTTGFGSIEGHTTEESESHGFSVGFSFGCEFTAPFGLSKASVKTSVENSFNWGVASTHEVTETWGYTTAVGEDKVVFTAIPFDVYYYEVLSSPDPVQIGETVTINVPRPPGKYHQEVNFYNEHNGDGYDLDNDVLIHTVGSPFTYPNKNKRDQLKSDANGRGLYSQHYLEVGVGSGSGVITLEDLTRETSSYDYDLSVSVEAEIGAGGIVAGASTGYQYGYSYTTTVTTGTYIKGEVPDIPASGYTAARQFHWGLIAYPVEDGPQKFTMVSYWVGGM